MKKLFAIILTVCFAFAIAGCGLFGENETTAELSSEDSTGASEIEIQVQTTKAPESTEQPTTKEQTTTATETTVAASKSADEIVKESPVDLTLLIGSEDLSKHQNQHVTFNGGMVIEQYDSEGEERMFLYRQDGSGSEGDDLYVKVMFTGESYTFIVDTEICDKDSDAYKIVQGLRSGDIVDIEAVILSDSTTPRITAIEVK